MFRKSYKFEKGTNLHMNEIKKYKVKVKDFCYVSMNSRRCLNLGLS